MSSRFKLIQSQTFTGGMTSDAAPEVMRQDQYRYMLNCNILSSAEGDVGIVTNVFGNVEIPIPMPPSGITKGAIGVALDEENGFLYFAMWNSDGYHTWYRYSNVSGVVDVVIQSRTDTSDVDIFQWPEDTLILHANVVNGNLLYWTMKGQPARKINIRKAMDKSDLGYGAAIAEEWTRAFKRTSTASPFAIYFTDPDKKFNRLYGYQFQFAVRFHYDDNEISDVSDWSNVPNPPEEYFTGTRGIPYDNNGIKVSFETGSEIVRAVEVLMRRTNPEGGTMPWVSVVTLDKEFNNIPSDSIYTYNFYNDGAYAPIDPKYPIRNHSLLPREPLCQEFTKNAIVYANFPEGRPQVELDIEWTVDYEDIFLDEGSENKLNSPSFTFNKTGEGYKQSGGIFGGSAWRYILGTFIIGKDVKKGNVFSVTAASSKGGQTKYATYSVTAGPTDTALTIANKLVGQMRNTIYFNHLGDQGWCSDPTDDGLGNATFNIKMMNNAGWGYWQIPQNIYVNPVNTITLKDNGQSLRNIKNGSSRKYGIVYRDEDGRKEAVQSNDKLIVPIATMNDLGGIKKPIITFQIKHRPPLWAHSYSIVRTDDLVYSNYIYMLIQEAIVINTGTDSYYDLVVGSLFTFQEIHPNTILKYEFKKGDRVRLAYKHNPTPGPGDPDFTVATDSKDFEIIDYQPETEIDMPYKVTVNNSTTVLTTAASSDDIGSYIVINGHERLIVGANPGTSYDVNDIFPDTSSGSGQEFPSYKIINRRGVLRLKHDDDFPIDDLDIVEVYTPATGNASANENIFYEFGQQFGIINPGTDQAYHAGNEQNQSAVDDAIIRIDNGSSYVRNREFPTSNNPKNPQVLVAVVEDPNYSDYYVSNMYDDGKANGLDQGQGEVWFTDRIRWSNNYIEGTRINGLNDFDNSNRVDYNDKYGAIMRLLYSEDRLFIFKYLKDAWAPVYGRIIKTNDGNDLLTTSTALLPDMPTYYLWDGGVGDNPESVVRNGNNIYHISADSGVWCRIGGNGVEPISKTYPMDKDVREIIASANRAGARIISWFDRKNDNAEITIEPHQNVVYNSAFSYSSWNTLDAEASSGTVSITIITPPAHGTVSINGTEIEYTPDVGYNGPDTFTYELSIDGNPVGQRNVCINVEQPEGPKAFRAINPFCVIESDVRTGYMGWSDLEEFDTFTNQPTGNTKPNDPSDPDYIAPSWDPVSCEPQVMKMLFKTDNSGTTTVVPFQFNKVSLGDPGEIYIVVKKGGTLVKEVAINTPLGSIQNIDIEEDDVEVYFKGPAEAFDEIYEFEIPLPATDSNGIIEVYPEIFPNLNTLGVYNQSLNNLSQLNDSLEELTDLEELIIYNNDLSGALLLTNNTNLQYLSFFDNDITGCTSPTNFPDLRYFNAAENPSFTGNYDFTSCPDMEEIIAFNCDITGATITGLTNLVRFDMGNNTNLIAGYDFTSNPNIEVINLQNCPVTSTIWSSNNKVRGYFIANASVPEAQVHAGLAANIATIEAFQVSSMHAYTGPFNLDDATNLHFLWLEDLPLCTGFSINNTGNITNLNISGMASLNVLPSLGTNPLNGLVWFTGTGIGPTGADTIIIHISSLNIPPLDEFKAGPGSVIYGNYETATGPITPTSSSLTAYNDLISRNYTVIGPVPGS